MSTSMNPEIPQFCPVNCALCTSAPSVPPENRLDPFFEGLPGEGPPPMAEACHRKTWARHGTFLPTHHRTILLPRRPATLEGLCPLPPQKQHCNCHCPATHTNVKNITGKHTCKAYKCSTRIRVRGPRQHYPAWVWSCTNVCTVQAPRRGQRGREMGCGTRRVHGTWCVADSKCHGHSGWVTRSWTDSGVFWSLGPLWWAWPSESQYESSMGPTGQRTQYRAGFVQSHFLFHNEHGCIDTGAHGYIDDCIQKRRRRLALAIDMPAD